MAEATPAADSEARRRTTAKRRMKHGSCVNVAVRSGTTETGDVSSGAKVPNVVGHQSVVGT